MVRGILGFANRGSAATYRPAGVRLGLREAVPLHVVGDRIAHAGVWLLVETQAYEQQAQQGGGAGDEDAEGTSVGAKFDGGRVRGVVP